MFLQETHSTKKHENLRKYQWHGDMILAMEHLEVGVSVCVAFRYNLEYKLLSPEISDKDGRYYFTY